MAGRIMMRGVVALAMAVVWSMCLQAASAQANVIVTTESELSVREGESVTLVCTYTPRTEPFEFGSLQWGIGTTTLASFACPITTCTSTNSDTTKYTLDVDEMFSGNLTIAAVTLEDDDTYQCQVLLFYGSEQSTSRLIVNVPPQTVRIVDDETSMSTDMIPVILGETYTLTCSIQPGANPPAAIEWSADTVAVTQETQDDQAIDGSKLTASSRQVSITPTMDDHMTMVSCQVTHPALDTGMSSFVQLDVHVTPNHVDLEYGSEVVSDGETLTLQQGIAVTITCRSLGTRPASTLKWYLDGELVEFGVGVPEYSANADDDRLTDAASSIMMLPSRANHGQVLRCEASTFGTRMDTSLMLAVDGPPDPPVITGTLDNFYEYQQTTVLCQADNGHPAPTFAWFVGDRNLTADATPQMSADVADRIDATSQLSYTPHREDNGLALQCSVSHETLSQPMRVLSDTLTVNYCPLEVEVSLCPTVQVGASATMECQSGASNPASNLVWTQGVTNINDPEALETLFQETASPLGRQTTLRYTRNFTRSDVQQAFRCCSSQTSSCLTTVCSDPCVPDVQYPPETPVISRNIPGRSITEGTADLEITCRADGNPQPALVWIFADSPGIMLDQVQVGEAQLLRFREVRRAHAGIYRCIANNDIQSNSEADMQLIVDFPPTILNKANNRSAANEGSNTTLTCVAEGNPRPTITWHRLGNETVELTGTETEENSDYVSRVTSTLTIVDVQPKIDHADYQCNATSSLGTDKVTITLSGTSKPVAPSKLMIDEAQTTAAAIMLSWQPGFDGGVEQTFIVKSCWNHTTEDCQEVFGIRSSSYLIEELDAFSWYTITVSAQNSNGRSLESSEITTSTAPLPPSRYGIKVSNDNGLVSLTPDPDIELPEEICYKVETPADGHCNQRSRCYSKATVIATNVRVQKPSDEKVTVVSHGRGLCSTGESITMAPLLTPDTSQSKIMGAIIGAVVILALLVVIIIVVRRNYDRKHKGSSKLPHTARCGPEGEPTEKNGQVRPFLSGGYCAYNPVYDDVSKDDPEKAMHVGRVVSDDGLIYAEVAHTKAHPAGQPPIRTEDATIYASLDFNKMKDGGESKPVDSNKNESEEKEALIYENIKPQGRPASP